MEYEHRNVGDNTATSAEQPFDSQTFFKNHLVRTDDGALEIKGDNLQPLEMALLETEKRRRGSQSATTREKLRADKATLELTKVKEIVPTIDATANEINPKLKYSDPDEYIRLSLEQKAHDPYKDAFATASSAAAEEAGQMTIDSVISDHNKAHPDKPIDMGMLEMDLPPRLVNEFTSGKMSPASFLEQAATILYSPTQVANPDLPNMPDLGTVGGQTNPTDDGSNDALIANYANAVI